jgi:uncharacterized membrane protein YfcA
LNPVEAASVLTGGFIAGAINSIAGGGTLVSFPALLALGRDPLLANATNAVGLCTGSLASAFGFRHHVSEVKHRLPVLLALPLVGGVIGAALLVRTPSSTFAGLIPYLILGATLLFALQEPIGRVKHAPVVLAFPLLLGIGIYGGYFGAGIGILLLATLGMLGLSDIHEKNVVKNLVAAAINGVAAIVFVWRGVVIWQDAVLLGAGAIGGGYAGARLATRLGRTFVRRAVVFIGLGLTVWYFAHPA